MTNLRLSEVHIGQAIEKRIDALGITRTEFGQRIGVQQQHVKRILERDTMETKKLIKVCKALDFNFFTLFCDAPNSIYSYMSAIALGEGDAQLNIGDAAVIADLANKITRIESLEMEVKLLRDQIASKDDTIASKNETIELLKASIKQ